MLFNVELFIILEQLTKKHRVARMIMLIIGALIFAIFYNAYVAPNHLVYGGVGGLAIVVNKLTGIPNIVIIDVFTSFNIVIHGSYPLNVFSDRKVDCTA